MSQGTQTQKNTSLVNPNRKATNKQVGGVLDLIARTLRKLSFDEIQVIIKNAGLFLQHLTVMLTNFLAMTRNMFTVTIGRVDRTRSPEQVLIDLGRAQYVNADVVATMPGQGKGVEENTPLTFFKVGRYLKNTDEELAEYELRGLKPADPYLVAEYNRENPAFADDKPNATIWKDKDGKWCYLACDRRDDGRYVDVGRDGYGWYDGWWSAGVPK